MKTYLETIDEALKAIEAILMHPEHKEQLLNGVKYPHKQISEIRSQHICSLRERERCLPSETESTATA